MATPSFLSQIPRAVSGRRPPPQDEAARRGQLGSPASAPPRRQGASPPPLPLSLSLALLACPFFLSCPLGTSFRGCLGSTFSITAKPCKTTQKVVGAGRHSWGRGRGVRLRGGDLDKDTLAFGAQGRWETWQDRGINRDAKHTWNTKSPRAMGVWVPAGPLRTAELGFPKGPEAPSFCLPSSTPFP